MSGEQQAIRLISIFSGAIVASGITMGAGGAVYKYGFIPSEDRKTLAYCIEAEAKMNEMSAPDQPVLTRDMLNLVTPYEADIRDYLYLEATNAESSYDFQACDMNQLQTSFETAEKVDRANKFMIGGLIVILGGGLVQSNAAYINILSGRRKRPNKSQNAPKP